MAYQGQGQYESYKPPYKRGSLQRRPTDHGGDSYDRRPREPSRSRRPWDERTREAESSSSTTMRSSRSPINRARDVGPTATKDPRREAEAPMSTVSITAQSPTAVEGATFEQYIRNVVQQALAEERVQQAEVKVESMRQKEKEAKMMFSSHVALHDINATNTKREETILTTCSQLALKSKESTAATTDHLPTEVRDLLRGVLPPSTQPSQQSEIDDLRTQIHDLIKTTDALNERIRDGNLATNELKGIHTDLASDVKAVQQSLKQVETLTLAQTRETPKSPPNHDLEDELETLKAQNRETKHQLANLSSTFVGAEEHKITTEEIGKVKESTHKIEQSLVQLQSDTASLKTMNEQNAAAQASNQLQDEVTKVQEEVSGMREEVKKLMTFQGHYEKFYTTTQEEVKQLNIGLATADGKSTKLERDTVQHIKDIDVTCDRQQKALDALKNQYRTSEEKCTKAIAAVRTEIDTFRGGALQSINTAHNQLDSAIGDIQSLKTSVNQTSHSIQSLSTRYNTISTQKLHRSIMATIEPMIPRLSEIPDLQVLRGELAQLRAALDAITQKQAITDQQRDQTVRAQPTDIAQQQAHATQVAELTQQTIQLKNASDRCSNELRTLSDKLAVIQTTVDNQRNNPVINSDMRTELVELRNDLKLHQSTNHPLVNHDFEIELKELRGWLESVQSEIEKMMATIGESTQAIEHLRVDAAGLDDLRSSIGTCQTDLKTYEQRLPEFEATLSRVPVLEQMMQAAARNADKADTDRHNTATATAELRSIKEELSDSKMEDEELRVRVERLENAIFPLQDRYVVCNSLASKITEAILMDKFTNCLVKNVRFSGGKQPDTRKSSRYALLWIAADPGVDNAITKVIQTESGKKWMGRTVEIRRIHRDEFKQLWMEEPDSVAHMMSQAGTASPSIGTDHISETPTVVDRKAVMVPRSKMRTHQDEDEDTIEVKSVARSSVLPDKLHTQDNDVEVQDSDVEGILSEFGATRDGRRSNRPPIARNIPPRPSTPSSRGLSKRNAPDSGSSRPSSKRNRLG